VCRGARLLIGALLAFSASAQPEKQAAMATPLASDPGWPRQYTDGNAKLVVYQPQIDTWKDFRQLEGRFAVALTPAKNGKPIYGSVSVKSDTLVDTDARVVALSNFTIDPHYPSAKDEAEDKDLAALTSKLFPKEPPSVALDRVLAYVDTSQFRVRQTSVALDPPPILVSNQPAVLVMIDGEPVLFDIEKTNLQKVMNTNWDLFFDKEEKRYYLRNDKAWLSAKTLDDAWKLEKKLPKDFVTLPDTPDYREVKASAALPAKDARAVLVLVARKPTELIVIDGEPVMQAVRDTQLMWVANTECDLFFSNADQQYYFLTSGRWFRTPQLRGAKWEAATEKLPADFKQIPPNHPRAHVLASVPGTRQAEDAVLMASIPKTATIDRNTAKATVQYVGEPEFKPIEGTNISYATNTPNDVLKIGDSYYLCLDAVWFMSGTPNGPWVIADKVPEEIYKIPPESPKYNVTYVSVYESTPSTVTYGYTSGYVGVYVGYGVSFWGTGYYYPPYYGYGYYPYPVYWPCGYYTYGASAWYNPATGAYGRGSAVYGPYGGYGRAAAYNPSTGRYSWGQTAWGPYGAAASGGFYNPNTGGWGGRVSATNGYQTWSQSVVGRGDQYARTASYSDSRGTIGAARTSSGGSAIAGRGSQGQGFVARSGAGDVYAGRDGNVYKRDQAGNWYQNNGGSWDSVNRPNSQSRTGANTANVQQLNRDAAARSQGNYNTQRSNSMRQSSGYSGARYGGGGFASRGGGRRR
jgi:hypothetical protein